MSNKKGISFSVQTQHRNGGDGGNGSYDTCFHCPGKCYKTNQQMRRRMKRRMKQLGVKQRRQLIKRTAQHEVQEES